MKSYTDLEQSRKLESFLPLKSADMHYVLIDTDSELYSAGFGEYIGILPHYPCWSLTALLDILPNEIITDNRFECHYPIDIRKYDGGDNITLYQIAYGNDRGLSGSWHDMINTGEKENIVDCCVQMIIELKELKML